MTARLRLEYEDGAASAALRRIASRLRDPAPALDAVGASLAASARLRFRSGRGPDGAPWKPSARARREGGQTLVDTARLARSIAHRVSGRAVEVGTNVAYASAHQFGARTPPRTIRPRNRKALAFRVGGRLLIRKSARHPGSTIPARPFLGADAADRREIARIVSRWLGGGGR